MNGGVVVRAPVAADDDDGFGRGGGGNSAAAAASVLFSVSSSPTEGKMRTVCPPSLPVAADFAFHPGIASLEDDSGGPGSNARGSCTS